MNNIPHFVLLAVFAAVLVCCDNISKDKPSGRLAREAHPMEVVVPEGFPEPSIPRDNPLTQIKAELGRKLFFDPLLSRDSSLSCASCHLPERAFSDTLALSRGVGGTMTERNAPSILNVAFHPYLMREGGNRNLELQALAPLEGEHEMGLPVKETCDRLNADETYRQMFRQAFGNKATPYTLTRALASFERTLVSADAPYDRFRQGDSAALSPSARLGLRLFMSPRLACADCHTGEMFTDFSFRNNGLYEKYNDRGRARLTLRIEDEGKFKVPSLRNVQLTAPYMYDGSLASLDEVLEHYAAGGKHHPARDSLVRGFVLTDEEKKAVIDFLESLTGASATGFSDR